MMKSKKKRNIIITIIIALLLLTTGGIYYVYISIYPPIVNLDRTKYPVVGIDISAHNGTIDFRKVKSDDISFVYIKATEGASFKDPLFDRNYDSIRAAGIPVGVYHFFRFDINGTLQAMNLMKVIAGKQFQLPIGIDIEEHGNPEIPTSSVNKRLQDMIDYLSEQGINVIIYTNVNGYKRFLRNNFNDYLLWICRFTNPGDDVDWQLWQYSHWGEVQGIKGDVDLDVFQGDKETFQRWIDNHSF